MLKYIKFRSLGLVMLFALAAGINLGGQESAHSIEPDGLTKVSWRIGGDKMSIAMHTLAVTGSAPGGILSAANAASRWACTGGHSPCHITVSGEFVINKHLIRFPTELLVNLGDPVTVRAVREPSGEIDVTFEGGDASVGYKVVVAIKRDAISNFKVYSGLDDSRAVVEVQYYPPVILN